MKRYSLRPDVQLECVYVYRDHVDFRLGYRGLSVLVEHELEFIRKQPESLTNRQSGTQTALNWSHLLPEDERFLDFSVFLQA